MCGPLTHDNNKHTNNAFANVARAQAALAAALGVRVPTPESGYFIALLGMLLQVCVRADAGVHFPNRWVRCFCAWRVQALRC